MFTNARNGGTFARQNPQWDYDESKLLSHTAHDKNVFCGTSEPLLDLRPPALRAFETRQCHVYKGPVYLPGTDAHPEHLVSLYK